MGNSFGFMSKSGSDDSIETVLVCPRKSSEPSISTSPTLGFAVSNVTNQSLLNSIPMQHIRAENAHRFTPASCILTGGIYLDSNQTSILHPDIVSLLKDSIEVAGKILRTDTATKVVEDIVYLPPHTTVRQILDRLQNHKTSPDPWLEEEPVGWSGEHCTLHFAETSKVYPSQKIRVVSPVQSQAFIKVFVGEVTTENNAVSHAYVAPDGRLHWIIVLGCKTMRLAMHLLQAGKQEQAVSEVSSKVVHETMHLVYRYSLLLFLAESKGPCPEWIFTPPEREVRGNLIRLTENGLYFAFKVYPFQLQNMRHTYYDEELDELVETAKLQVVEWKDFGVEEGVDIEEYCKKAKKSVKQVLGPFLDVEHPLFGLNFIKGEPLPANIDRPQGYPETSTDLGEPHKNVLCPRKICFGCVQPLLE
mmetsp:Transcript_34914/g.42096  ORF Transcript_34914/g.42096 Transcript_34914/m.42096 type:complete len:418 (+) Transcript_34914:207-1460(+)|eukprot:CAMPEP_0197849604 /NCGR_PEP_ID=MMETSP1438-20131217/12687_1 /TAXON_ID=1461541 /ORGANISM="Pterosperma sp., Strain CCMP1384" /LENGTH=417 /DNA_ID=CAMNT_0043462377 /DNA_START=199 /DNA_END=1452 /DNA_ORIENTATION=+